MSLIRSRRPLALALHRHGATFAAYVVLLALSRPTAAAVAYEGFDYPVGTRHGDLTGGTGFRQISSTLSSTVAAGSLSDPTGTLLTSGGHLEGGGGNDAGMSGYAMDALTPWNRGDFWVSFLVRQNAVYSGAPSGMYMTGSGGGMYFVGQPAVGHTDPSILAIGRNGVNFTSTGVPFEAGRDYFLVLHIQRGEGSDLATLYVNPTPGAEPPSGGTAFPGVDFVSLPVFTFLAAGPPPPSPNFVAAFDELRLGTTYAEVSPVVPEPAASLLCLAPLTTLALRRRRRVQASD